MLHIEKESITLIHIHCCGLFLFNVNNKYSIAITLQIFTFHQNRYIFYVIDSNALKNQLLSNLTKNINILRRISSVENIFYNIFGARSFNYCRKLSTQRTLMPSGHFHSILLFRIKFSYFCADLNYFCKIQVNFVNFILSNCQKYCRKKMKR